MKQLNIPNLNKRITLARPWTFKLEVEGRNQGLAEIFGAFKEVTPDIEKKLREMDKLDWEDTDNWPENYTKSYSMFHLDKMIRNPKKGRKEPDWIVTHSWYESVDVTLPAGTVLIVRRIYIRNGAPDFDSVTFSIEECPGNSKLKKERFWAGLKYVNQIVHD